MAKLPALLACSLLLAVPPSAFGQAADAGVRGGLNVFSLEDDAPLQDLESRSGLNVGAFITVHLTDAFAIQPEVSFTEKGAMYSEEEPFMDATRTFDVDLRISYLEIPVLVKFSPAVRIGSLQPSLYAGPAFGFLGSARGDFETESSEGETEVGTVDFRDVLNKRDVGLVVGGGVGYPVGSASFTVEARYTRGLLNIDAEDDNRSLTHSGFSAMVGVSMSVRQ